MSTDHDLGDLIIDNIEPANSKTKSILTIIALMIVMLIVGIILTRIILKDPENTSSLIEENNTEMVSPDLTLQNQPAEDEEPSAPIQTIDTIEEPSVPLPVIKEEPVIKKVPKIVTPKVIVKKPIIQKPTPKVEKKVIPKKPIVKTQKPKKIIQKSIAKEIYYIQVGSFTQTPSSRFLSVIKNSGFTHKITSATANGTKKLLIGPYSSRASVDQALIRVRDRINKSAFVVKK